MPRNPRRKGKGRVLAGWPLSPYQKDWRAAVETLEGEAVKPLEVSEALYRHQLAVIDALKAYNRKPDNAASLKLSAALADLMRIEILEAQNVDVRGGR